MDEELKNLFEAIRQENVTAHAETRRHSDVTAERLEKKIDLALEGITSVNERLGRETNALRRDMNRGFAETQALI